jgi:hypothetical protein
MLLLFIPTVILLVATDASKMYHTVRGQDTIKLYVIFNALEVGLPWFPCGKEVADDRSPIDCAVLSAKMSSILCSLKRHYHPLRKSLEKDERDNKQGLSSFSPYLSAMFVSP